MEYDDWCVCPNSNFPALYSAYVKWVEVEGVDPVLGKPVDLQQVVRVADPKLFLEEYNRKNPEDEEEGGDQNSKPEA